MTLGEVAQFRINKHPGEVVTWADLERNGGALQKVAEKGHGEFPRLLALCSLH